jgi:hypothetical protein
MALIGLGATASPRGALDLRRIFVSSEALIAFVVKNKPRISLCADVPQELRNVPKACGSLGADQQEPTVSALEIQSRTRDLPVEIVVLGKRHDAGEPAREVDMGLRHEVVDIARHHHGDPKPVVERHGRARDHRTRLAALDATVNETRYWPIRNSRRIDAGRRRAAVGADRRAHDLLSVSRRIGLLLVVQPKGIQRRDEMSPVGDH